MSDTAWSEDRVTTLKSLWLDGLSASQIAKQLGGVTRNAVIGKVHRLGLSGRGAPSTPASAAVISAPRPRRPARAERLARAPLSASRLPAPPPSLPAEGPALVDNLVHLPVYA